MSGKQTCPGGASVLRAKSSLSNCYAYNSQGDVSSSLWKEQAPQAASTLGLIPYDDVLENKLTKPHQNKPHTLFFATICSSTIVQTTHVTGNRAPCLRGTSRDADLGGHLIPETCLPQIHSVLFFSPFRRFLCLCAPLLFSKGNSSTSWLFQD